MSRYLFKKRLYIIICLTSLITGLCIYVLFRSNTYIALIFSDFTFISIIRKTVAPIDSIFLKFYFVDFLWALSLYSGLSAIFLANKKGCLICSIVVFLFNKRHKV